MSIVRFKSSILYKVIKNLNNDELNAMDKAVVDKFNLLYKLNGLEAKGSSKDLFNYCLENLRTQKNIFTQKMEEDRIDNMQLISDVNEIPEMPTEYLQRYAHDKSSDGVTKSWYISFEPENYDVYMSHIKNSQKRHSVYLARHSIACKKNPLHNGKTIEEILDSRLDLAKSLGYTNFLEMSLSTKMARNPKEIFNLLEKLRTGSLPKVTHELNVLANFAKSSNFLEEPFKINDKWLHQNMSPKECGNIIDQMAGKTNFFENSDPNKALATPTHPISQPSSGLLSQLKRKIIPEKIEIIKGLEPWDIPYVSRKYREYTFPFNKKVLFDYNIVLSKMFQLCDTLFNVTFERITNPPELNSNLYECFKIYRNGNHVAHLFIHPHKSDSKIRGVWSEFGQGRSKIRGHLPYAVLSLDLIPVVPNNGASLKMDFAKLNTLFQQFGRLIPHLLTEIDNSEISGVNFIEKDCENVSANFFAHFLTCPSLLTDMINIFPNDIEEACVQNPRLESVIKPRLLKDLITETRQLSSYQLLHDCFYSHVDLDIHSSKTYHLDLFKRLWPLYNPFKLPANINPLATFTSIFIEDQAASFYGRIWSKVIAADLFSYFLDPSTEDLCSLDNLKFVGNKLLENVFSVGASIKQRQALSNFKSSLHGPYKTKLILQNPQIFSQEDEKDDLKQSLKTEVFIRNEASEYAPSTVLYSELTDRCPKNSTRYETYEINAEPLIRTRIY